MLFSLLPSLAEMLRSPGRCLAGLALLVCLAHPSLAAGKGDADFRRLNAEQIRSLLAGNAIRLVSASGCIFFSNAGAGDRSPVFLSRNDFASGPAWAATESETGGPLLEIAINPGDAGTALLQYRVYYSPQSDRIRLLRFMVSGTLYGEVWQGLCPGQPGASGAGLADLADSDSGSDSGSGGQCPEFDTAPSLTNEYTDEDLWSAKSYTVSIPSAQGHYAFDSCGLDAPGKFQPFRDLRLTYAPDQVRDLEFRTSADCDTVLLVNDPDSVWHHDDDNGEGTNARLRLRAAKAGNYDVWVGIYDSACDVTLELETYESDGGDEPEENGTDTAGCIDADYSSDDISEHSDAELYDPLKLSITAGGSVDMGNCSMVDGADGFFATSPDYVFYFSRENDYELDFSVDGECDTMLILQTGNGNFFFDDDDGEGNDPKIRLSRPSDGVYKVWIGTYGESNCSSTLTLETYSP